jgi:P4 family phage/plasmid primase-like protien
MKTNVKTLSDLDLAIMLEDQFGTENLIKAPSGIWHFNGLTWRLLSDDELKAAATILLAERVDSVMRSRLSGMLEVFNTYNWISNVDFELGDPSIVVMADGYRACNSGAWNKIDADRELRRRICLPASYTEARPEQFDTFLRDILCDAEGKPLTDSKALTELIWEMLGYCLATHTRYERCFILCGPGANGKSVLGAVAKAMVGRTNTASVQPAQMGSVFQRSNLEGKLLNLVTELNQKEELQDGLLKAIVSGEMMSVERKFQPVREIEPFAKHIILTNHLPRIRDYSDGLFRRVSIIPLQRQFLGSTADPLLINKLTGELDAITSRALDALGGSLIETATSLNHRAALPQKIHGDQTTITSCSISQSAYIPPPMAASPYRICMKIIATGLPPLVCADSWAANSLPTALRLLASQNPRGAVRATFL